jgi:CBS domain containing-hemolysin-like protein
MELALLALSIILVVVCGLFVSAEFSLITVNRPTVERLAGKGDRQAKGVLRALRTLSTQLSSAQVGITVTNLAIGFLAEPAVAQLIEGPLEAIGLPTSIVPGLAITLGIAVATAVTMVFGELVPKNLALSKPLASAKFVQSPLLFFSKVMKYPIALLNNSANFLLKHVGVEPQEELASARSADELVSLVRRSAAKGTLAKETALMLERSLNFGELTALDVMTPRVRVRAIQGDEMVSEVFKLARMSGLSRFPVYGKSLDDIIGIVHIKYAMSIAHELRDTTPVSNIMRPPVLVPASNQLEPLLEALRKGGLQIAVVIDEFGGVDGIVTIEDLLEELVGEVKDEHDRSGTSIRKRPNGSWALSGLLRPDKIGEELGIYLSEEEEVETIAGLITHKLERMPKDGDSVILDGVDRDGKALSVELKVERMDGHRIDRAKMFVVPHNQEAE